MTIKIVNKIKDSESVAKSLKVGETGMVIGNLYQGHVLLKTAEGIVSLTDPFLTWNPSCSLPIRRVNLEIEVTV